MARHFETWVICGRRQYEQPIREWINAHGDPPGLSFHFVSEAPFDALARRIPGLRYVAYKIWHWKSYRYAKALHRAAKFDLIHMVTWSGYREPGYAWKLDAPFVWGPVGGTENYPWRFYRGAGLSCLLFEGSRAIANTLQLRWGWRAKRAARRAAVLIAANSSGEHLFKKTFGVKTERMLDVGVSTVKATPRIAKQNGRPLRLMYCGLLEHRKALHLVLHALNELPASVQYELRIVGDGPARARWMRIARRLDIAVHCRWLGSLPLDEALHQYDEADVFVFPSLRDTGGTVILEALSRGIPVICLDHNGAGDVVTPSCGMKVPVTTPREVIAGIRTAIIELAENPDHREALARGAAERARDFLWSEQGDRLAKIFDCAVASYASQRNTALDNTPRNGSTGCKELIHDAQCK